MMHQRFEPAITLDDRPEREEVIDKDEIIGLVIDLETMTSEDVYKTYFPDLPKRHR